MDTATPLVLIVDDEPHIVMAIDFLMQQAGYHTLQAHDGQAALHMAQQQPPDLIILDVMMPHMDGFEVAQQLRRDPIFQDTKILFLTARSADQDKIQGYGSGGDLYLTKPFDNQELVDMVSEMLQYG
ncbi:MAG: response regulator [Bacteroidetes bacterium]|nr:MAG: response regulator [Bacteroidota bacterium]